MKARKRRRRRVPRPRLEVTYPGRTPFLYSLVTEIREIRKSKTLPLNLRRAQVRHLRRQLNEKRWVNYRLVHPDVGEAEFLTYINQGLLTRDGRQALLKRWRQRLAFYRTRQREPDTTARAFGLLTYHTVGGVFTEPGTIIDLLSNKEDLIMAANKKPLTNEPHVGIEVEFFSPKGAAPIRRALKQAKLARYVNLGSDGSLNWHGASGDEGRCGECEGCQPECDNGCCWAGACEESAMHAYELRVCAPQRQYVKVLARLGKVFAEIEAEVNETCGLHVHLDMRKSTGRDPALAYSNLVRALPLLQKLVPPERLDNDEYRATNHTDDLDEELENNHRYTDINAQALRRYNTLEVRLHHGTVDTKLMRKWIRLLIALASAKKALPRSTRVDRLHVLTQHIPLPKYIQKYVAEAA